MNPPLLLISALITAFVTPLALAEEIAPDALVKSISEEVIAAVRQNKGIQAGDASKIAELVEARILPHFDFRHTTQIAMGVSWRRATPEQREQLTRVAGISLAATYRSAFAEEVRNHGIDGLISLLSSKNRVALKPVSVKT